MKQADLPQLISWVIDVQVLNLNLGEIMQTQVAIVGCGPAGLLLSEILSQHGIENIILEKNNREHILLHGRAGLLDKTSCDLLSLFGLSKRIQLKGQKRNGYKIILGNNQQHLFDVNMPVTIYCQSLLQEDLLLAAEKRSTKILTQVSKINFCDVTSTSPHILFEQSGKSFHLDCDFIVGCDGVNGISREYLAEKIEPVINRIFPFKWLGIFSATPPLADIIYTKHARGFALASARHKERSRYYIQVPLEATLAEWHEDRIWCELKMRFPKEISDQIITGCIIEKSLIPIRCIINKSMQYGRLFLVGDAAQLLPPTGAKGLNLALYESFVLSHGLIQYYQKNMKTLLDSYSAIALRRVFAAAQTSLHMTNLLHQS